MPREPDTFDGEIEALAVSVDPSAAPSRELSEAEARADVIRDVLNAPSDEGAEAILAYYLREGLLDEEDAAELRAERRGE